MIDDEKVADVGEIEVHNFDRLLSGTLSNNGHTLKVFVCHYIINLLSIIDMRVHDMGAKHPCF